MKMFDLNQLLRENIRNIKPYSSARDEYSGTEGIFLDANENPIGSVSEGHYNRYPDPYQGKLKSKIGDLKRLKSEHIFLGNGSDEAIDLLFRAFCEPKKDNVIILPPTYGMYQVCADINDVEVRKVALNENYDIRLDETLSAIDENTKVIFICSPNNPTGNNLNPRSIYKLMDAFDGLVVVDEAYIDFSNSITYVRELSNRPNLVVLQTFSKAWGMAGLRLGMAFAAAEIIEVLNKIKYPYNINEATQEYALGALSNILGKEDMVQEILFQREWMREELMSLRIVEKVYHSEANFLFVKMEEAHEVYKKLIEKKIIVRDRSSVQLCDDCLRISIGTAEENQRLISELQKEF